MYHIMYSSAITWLSISFFICVSFRFLYISIFVASTILYVNYFFFSISNGLCDCDTGEYV